MEYKKIDYNKYTKEQLIELLEISDKGAFYLRNECDALNYRLEKIKDALIEANKKIDKSIDLLKTLDEDTLSNMQLALEIIVHIEYILKGEDK